MAYGSVSGIWNKLSSQMNLAPDFIVYRFDGKRKVVDNNEKRKKCKKSEQGMKEQRMYISLRRRRKRKYSYRFRCI